MQDISKKIDRLNLEILKTVKQIADKQNIKFFLVGATVRDMILNYVYDITIYRKTNDIDFAVRLKNWNQYKQFIDEIVTQGFKKDQKILHRYRYNGMIIDFIPFGDISSDDETITWPDNDKKEMSILGFEDVYQNTEELLINTEPEIIIRTASVEGLLLLKIFAWNARTADLRIKDAKDIYIILSTYLDAGNRDRLFDGHTDIVDKDFDYQIGGARLLGRDITKMVSPHILKELLIILKSERVNKLVQEMAQYESIPYEGDERINWCEKIINSLFLGLTDNK